MLQLTEKQKRNWIMHRAAKILCPEINQDIVVIQIFELIKAGKTDKQIVEETRSEYKTVRNIRQKYHALNIYAVNMRRVV